MSLALEAFQNERCGEMNTVLPRLTPSASSIHWLADRQRGQRYVRREALTLAQVQKRGGYPRAPVKSGTVCLPNKTCGSCSTGECSNAGGCNAAGASVTRPDVCKTADLARPSLGDPFDRFVRADDHAAVAGLERDFGRRHGPGGACRAREYDAQHERFFDVSDALARERSAGGNVEFDGF